jgi:hypothetical protein
VSEVDALQTTLAAEHAAVHEYGVLGAQTSRTAQPTLSAAVEAAYEVHRGRRDDLVAALTGLDAVPTPAAAAYQLPEGLGDPAVATARALELERGSAATYAYLVGSSTGERRAWAVEALRDAAVRGLGFGGQPETLPGT